MSWLEIVAIIVVPILLLLAGALSAAETSLTRMSRARADAMSTDDDSDEPSALRLLLDQRVRVLSPLWAISGFLRLSIAALAAMVAAQRWSVWAIVPAVALVWVVHSVVTGRARATALDNLDETAQRVANRLGSVVTRAPVVWLGVVFAGRTRIRGDGEDDESDSTTVSESELLALTELAAEDQAIDADEQELIESSIAFGDTTVREVMVPRPDMVTVTSRMRVVDVLGLVVLHGFSRFPVTGEGIDDIVGVAHAKDLLSALLDGDQDDPVAEHLRPCRVVPETKQIAKLLREMQSDRIQIAVVIDEYGGTAGMCTLEDLIEELVGEITDEFDVEEPLIESLENGAVRVNGKAALDALDDLLGTRLPEGEWSTVGGLIFNTLGHVPETGETVDLEQHRLTVEVVAGSRIARVLIEPLRLQTESLQSVSSAEGAER